MSVFGNIIKKDALEQQSAQDTNTTEVGNVVEEAPIVEAPVEVVEKPNEDSLPEIKIDFKPIEAKPAPAQEQKQEATPPPMPKEPRFENGRELADVDVIEFADVKSQCARLISGLSKPTDGEVRIYGIAVNDKTRVPMVFQQYSSFPWMRVIKNVALPMKMKGVGKKERNERAMSLLKLVGLDGQEDKWARYPDLSGGQLQRVSLARNLAADSQIMILDEATSALDIFSKRDMQQALLNIYYDAEYDPTIINITHDISEAVMLSNRIIILQSNPSKVYKVVDIDFEGRRTQDIRNTEKFNEYVKQIESIMDEVAKR